MTLWIKVRRIIRPSLPTRLLVETPVVTFCGEIILLKADQYESERSFDQVGEWHPWRYNRHGQLICEVASARFALGRPDPSDPPLEVEVALIRDWRRLLPVEAGSRAADDAWEADLTAHQRQFWEEG